MINKHVTVDMLNKFSGNTMVDHLGIEFIDVGPEFVQARMPVDHRTVQPLGLLHGGASVALAETLGSVAASVSVDPDRFICVGLEINANHLRSVRSGWVSGTAKPIHIGRSTHVWQVDIVDEDQKLVCTSRITMAVLPKDKKQ